MVRLKERPRAAAPWPRRAMAVGVALLLLLFLLPLLLLPGEVPPAETMPLPTATLPVVPPAATPVAGWDNGQSLKLLLPSGEVEEITLDEYLWRVVAAEMPASFHPEALKAQTVAARTYCLYQRSGAQSKHPGADVCADFTCCQAYLTREQAAAGWGAEAEWYSEKVARAVADTDGLLCLYGGQPIDAVFFSSAAGKTSDAVEVWGTDVPYLVSVDSPEGTEVPGWQTMVTFTPSEFSARLLAQYPEADLSGDPTGWFGGLTNDPSGAVAVITVGGVEMTGTKARSVFGLSSAHFTAAATAESVTFWVTGYGHGVGMSQYGANAMAGEGKSFQEILEWYYTGAQVSGMK